tara:strand:- start:1091 stop:1783 length:693 start_codon:yes stop_codon:yes gene_type:complete
MWLVAAAHGLSLPALPRLDQPVELKRSHGFSAAANWLVPGHVLLGAIPNKGRGSTLDRVRAICESGCRTFVSLQAELPPLDSDLPFPAWTSTSEREGRMYLVDARACCTEPQFVRFPIDDLQPASSVEWLSETVADIANRVRKGETLYIHCFAGRGRTGLVAACLLGELYEGMEAAEALERVSTYYRLRASFCVSASRAQDGMSPETEPQRQQVRDFFSARALERSDATR